MNHTAKAPGKSWADRLHGLRTRLDRPWIRTLVQEGKCGLIALALSPAAMGALPLPVYLGYLLSLEADGGALAGAIGCSLGAVLFWQEQAFVEMLAGTVAALFAIALFSGTPARKRQWFAPLVSGTVSGAMGLLFILARANLTSADLWAYLVQMAAAMGSALVFCGLSGEKTPILKAAGAGILCLGLCQILCFGILDLGLAAGAFFACAAGDLPTAVLCGLGADLSRITPVPITPILALSLLTMTLTGRHRAKGRLSAAFWSLPVMYIAGTMDPVVPLGLFLGSLAALPIRQPKAQPAPAAPEALGAGARLEIAAGALDYVGQLLAQADISREEPEPTADRAMESVCGTCPRSAQCSREAPPIRELLAQAAEGRVPQALRDRCAKSEALSNAFEAGLREARIRRQYALRCRESTAALCRQYRCLSDYLRRTAGRLEEPIREREARYRVEVGTAAMGKFGLQANGDRGAHFHGPGQTYFVILCDGMGSGHSAAAESDSALRLLAGMLRAGMPPITAMGTLNDLYVLRDTGGFSTVDLLELHLDTGRARLYKWGAAPSYLKYRSTARSLGTSAPPPGISAASEHGPEVIGLTMQRGEVLVLVSDGLSGPDTRSRIAAFPGRAPKALAESLLEDISRLQDDCTAVAVLLSPTAP